MQAARRHADFDFPSRLGRRAEAGPRRVLPRVSRQSSYPFFALAGIPYRRYLAKMHIRTAFLCMSAFFLFACEEPIVPNDPQNAAFYQSCQSGNWQSCVALGENYEHGNRVGWQPERAIALYEKACSAGYADGCQHAGMFLETGHALLQPDFKRATKYLHMACDANFLRSCVELGNLYHNGPIHHNQRRAIRLYERACDQGSPEACLRSGAMYRGGEGIAANPNKASALFARGCDGGSGQSCTFLGENYFLGFGVERNVSTGWSYLQKACAMKDAMACNVVQSPFPRVPSAEGSALPSKRAWKLVIAAPSPADIFAARNSGEMIDRLTRMRRAYDAVDIRNVHPELGAYVEAWKVWASKTITLCENDQRQQRNAADIEAFSGLMGAWLEKNESGERDEATLDRGMTKGQEVGRDIAGLIGSIANEQAATDGKALGLQARQLADYQDSLAIRLEIIYAIWFPPSAQRK